MKLVGLALLLFCTVLSATVVVRSLRSGSITGKGLTYRRINQPVLFWISVMGMALAFTFSLVLTIWALWFSPVGW